MSDAEQTSNAAVIMSENWLDDGRQLVQMHPERLQLYMQLSEDASFRS